MSSDQDVGTVWTPFGLKTPRPVALTLAAIKVLLDIVVLVSIRLQYAPGHTSLWVPSAIHLIDIFLYVVLWIEVWVHERPSRSHVIAWITFALLWGAMALSTNVAAYGMGWNLDAEWWHRYLLKPFVVVLDVAAIGWLVHALVMWAAEIRSDKRRPKEDHNPDSPATRESCRITEDTMEDPEDRQQKKSTVRFQEPPFNQQP